MAKPSVARDTQAEVLLAKVHELAIKQELANYETKANIKTWYRESTLHAVNGGTIMIVMVCVVVLSRVICYCNVRLRRQSSGVVINHIEMEDTPTMKMSIKRKVLFSQENTTTKETDISYLCD